MEVTNNITFFRNKLLNTGCRLVAVSKTQPHEKIKEAYDAGQRIFGENKVQELVLKHGLLPTDIEWHMIGHLQSNKVKQLVPHVSLIHSVDSFKLLQEIDKQAAKINRTIDCLLQVYIANEETKFGFDESEILALLEGGKIASLKAIKVKGLMGMATFTENKDQVRMEFRRLKKVFGQLAEMQLPFNIEMKELSMGMSQDYLIAIEEGSTLVRIGTSIFGSR
jgi:hypothetical protein